MSKGSWFYDNLKVGARRVAGGAGMFFHLPVPSLLSGRANEKRATRFIRESFCEKRTILHQPLGLPSQAARGLRGHRPRTSLNDVHKSHTFRAFIFVPHEATYSGTFATSTLSKGTLPAPCRRATPIAWVRRPTSYQP